MDRSFLLRRARYLREWSESRQPPSTDTCLRVWQLFTSFYQGGGRGGRSQGREEAGEGGDRGGRSHNIAVPPCEGQYQYHGVSDVGHVVQ